MRGYLSKIPGVEQRGILRHEPVATYWLVNKLPVLFFGVHIQDTFNLFDLPWNREKTVEEVFFTKWDQFLQLKPKPLPDKLNLEICKFNFQKIPAIFQWSPAKNEIYPDLIKPNRARVRSTNADTYTKADTTRISYHQVLWTWA